MGTFEQLGRKTDEILHSTQRKTMALYGAALKHAAVLAQKASEGARDAAAKVESALRGTGQADHAQEQERHAQEQARRGVNLHKER